MLSLVIPVFRNRENIDPLLQALADLRAALPGELEAVFVVDGSPDDCYSHLRERLPGLPLRSRLIELSRNFGAFSAIGAGLAHGRGDYFAVLAADLQEPPELVTEFLRILESGEVDVVLGFRTRRADPWLSQVLSTVFWGLYRRFVLPEVPRGGIDVFACTRQVRDRLLELRETNTNLMALLLWLGFRRRFVPYARRARSEGTSAWTLKKKLRYAMDSVFNFTDLPIRLLFAAGVAGTLGAMAASLIVLLGWWRGLIPVLGYTPIMLTVAFFGGLTSLGLGVVGQYLWLSLQNTRRRPNYIVRSEEEFGSSAGEPEAR